MWQCDSISNQSQVEKGNVEAYPCDVTFALSIIDVHEDTLRFLVRTLRLAKELRLVDTSCLIPGAFEPTYVFCKAGLMYQALLSSHGSSTLIPA